MSNSNSIQEQHTAGPSAIGFDYQFYYFIYLILDISHGDTIGFEVKDDVHIKRHDGSTILFQGKHSVQTNASGEIQNLTALDEDLWKTVSNWVSMVKGESDSKEFLSKYSFVLFTNKNEHFNEFITTLSTYQLDGNIKDVVTKLREFKRRTNNKTIENYLTQILNLNIKDLKVFLLKLKIDTGVDDLISGIKNKLMKTARREVIMEAIFESLFTALHTAKYLEIKDRKPFEISFEDFNNRFGRCFSIAFQERPLPRRELPVLLPEDLEAQTFIKQLIDIGEITPGSKKILKYTEQMLKVLNQFIYWLDNDLLFPHESGKCDENAILIWENKFSAKYRSINTKLASGIPVDDLEEDICCAALDIVDYLREQDLDILEGKLGVEFSNGHFYTLSDKLRLGWHLNWENKYAQE
ncbi:hypothetical protein FBD94_07990 [Pedobacter hiemivivus]|uniref:DUF4297 domain-containing protein n=1 Tax=Pedobacter hiemivivus TaxID=2530454 RepID=A0A4U1GEJ9_9SPHI|nr:hypothetical protein [Pedobacter hiemivivus]TKC62154.1 hypothetical protein FBD94_07990 [Pedobacter hiemivivus]